jgi:hypothetical protein
MPSQTAPATAEAPANGSQAAAPMTPRLPTSGTRTAVPPRRAVSVGPSGLSRSQVPLVQEYHYVPKDLGRLGIIAVATFAIMIILGILI